MNKQKLYLLLNEKTKWFGGVTADSFPNAMFVEQKYLNLAMTFADIEVATNIANQFNCKIVTFLEQANE